MSFMALHNHQPPILVGAGLLGGILSGFLEFVMFTSFMKKSDSQLEEYLKQNWEQMQCMIGGISCRGAGEEQSAVFMDDPAIQRVNANRCEVLIQIEGNYHGVEYLLADIKTKYQEDTGRETVLFRGFCIRTQTEFFPAVAVHIRTKDYFSQCNILPEQTLRTPLGRYYPAYTDPTNGMIVCIAGEKELAEEVCLSLIQRLQKWKPGLHLPFSLWIQPDGSLQLTINNYRIFDYGKVVVDGQQINTSLKLIQDFLTLLSIITN